ncbi:unnamed protein product [Bursaphelenchus okinawaensis]|uniref:XTP/dITP diphosphatase n=1 Tax=Bursaphelenchus okinawaensis TaxID=465554 RepID=A0A811KVB5_9BILA|nr:unnamed protein product [Bursaphelenchus okinawaensis]CAG9112413.1 unnamed protein product [Bursaphelenchus okinawaensis]
MSVATEHGERQPVQNVNSFVFISGNENKVRDAIAILGQHVSLAIRPVDLMEIQGKPSEVAFHKCSEAMKLTGGNVIVEDTALCLEALGGMPGPYIKWFVNSLNANGIYKMLLGFDSFNATIISTVAVGLRNAEGKDEIMLFEGRTEGRIVKPRGSWGERNGYDPCFEPNDQSQTYSQMDPETRTLHSARQKALRKVLHHLQKKIN